MKDLIKGVFLLGLLLLPGPIQAAAPAVPASPSLPIGRFSVDVIDQVTPTEAQAMRQAGVQLVRYYLSWNDAQPTAGSNYDWSHADLMLGTLAAQNLPVQAIVTGNPTWAASRSAGPVDRAPISVYYAFLQAAVTRYSAAPYTVQAWEIYNEPDSVDDWGTQSAAYAQLLNQDYTMIKAIAPSATVLMGGLAYDYFTDIGGPFVRNFLPDFLAAGGGSYTDAINFHHYKDSPSWSSFGAMLEALRADIARAGLQKPLVWSETGAPSSAQYGGTLASQADYLARSYAAGLGEGVSTINWFPLHDFDNPAYRYFNSHGLLYQDDTPKPSYTAYSVAAAALSDTTALRALAASEFADPSAGQGYSFQPSSGGGLVVAWTDQGATTQSWPVADMQGVMDVYGQPVTYSVSGSQAVLPVGTSPVYVRLDKPARFNDVALDSWYQPFVEALSAQGAVSGYADGTFRPFNNTTRGQISKMVVLALGWPLDTSAGQVFSDVPPSSPYYAVIDTAYAHGIISGYACGGSGEPCDGQNRHYFRLNSNVTRAQLSKMLTLARGWAPVEPGTGPQDFTDVPPSHPQYGFIEAVFEHGVVSGYGDRTFRPSAPVTRAQLAKMIQVAVTQP